MWERAYITILEPVITRSYISEHRMVIIFVIRGRHVFTSFGIRLHILHYVSTKICIIEVDLLRYYFESHLIYKCRYIYRQIIFNQLNIMVPYVDIISPCHSSAILWEIYVMWHKCHVSWLHFHFKRMLIMGLGQ